MIPEAVIAAALLGSPSGPGLRPDRLQYLASAIAWEADDDIDAAAALIVIGERESSWRRPVERCAVAGIGGWGTFGVAGLWTRRYPGGTCGPIGAQARAARAIWDWHWRDTGWSAPRTFGRYIGAVAGPRHPEAQRRARLFWTVRARLECACSI